MLRDTFCCNLVNVQQRWENPLFCKAGFYPIYLIYDKKFLNKNDISK